MANKIKYVSNRVIDSDGISDSASVYVYQTGGTTKVDIYSDEALTSPLANPYLVAAGAAVPDIFTDYEGDLRVYVEDSSGNEVDDIDPYTIPVERSELSVTVATRTAMKAHPTPTSFKRFFLFLTEEGREGLFEWDSSDLSSEVTLDSNEGIYVAPDSDVTGASGAWVRQFSGGVYGEWFGAKPDDAAQASANTTAIQAALDFLLNSTSIRRAALYLGDGVFHIGGSINLFDTAGGDARGTRGKIRIEGTGQTSLTDAQAAIGATFRSDYGTVLKFTQTDSTHGLVFSPDNTSGTYDRRFCGAKDLTIEYNGTGYGLYAHSCPGLYTDSITIRVTNTAGNGLYHRSAWNSFHTGLIITTIQGAAQTGDGFVISNQIYGGNIHLHRYNIVGFNNCVRVESGSAAVTTFTLGEGAIQKWINRGVLVEGAVGDVRIDCYAETGSGGPFFESTSTSSVSSLTVGAPFNIIGGTTSTAWLTECVFKLRNVEQYAIEGSYYFRPWVPFLKQRDSEGTVRGLRVEQGGATAIPFLFVGDVYESGDTKPSGYSDGDEIPQTFCVEGISMPSGVTTEIYDDTKHRLRRYDATISMSDEVSVGKMLEKSALFNAAYDMGNDPRKPGGALVTNSNAADAVVRLPQASAHTVGLVRTVVNKTGSAGNLLLRDGGGATTIQTLTPGDEARCVIVDIAGTLKWKVSLNTVVIGP